MSNFAASQAVMHRLASAAQPQFTELRTLTPEITRVFVVVVVLVQAALIGCLPILIQALLH